MDVRRLELLLELSRRGSMREVSEVLGVTTSTVSQQIAALAREVGTALLEPDGRRVRLTPAGRRLAEHAVTVLAAVEAARQDLVADAEPAGTVRVAAFASAIRTVLLPLVHELKVSHPSVRLVVLEQEPPEALRRLADDEVDLALTYDYNLAPVAFDTTLEARRLWHTGWSLGVPSRSRRVSGDAAAVFREFREEEWIVNSRHTADGDVVRAIASLAGFRPHVTHRADSLSLVQDMIVAGLGVGLLPAAHPKTQGLSLRRLRDPEIFLRTFAVTRRGRASWPALGLVLDVVQRRATSRG